MPDCMSTRTAARPHTSLLLKPVDAAKVLAISPRTLWGLTDRGEIPRIKSGGLVRYDPRDLMAWIARKKGTSAKRREST